jgi:protein-disulfide isomerase
MRFRWAVSAVLIASLLGWLVLETAGGPDPRPSVHAGQEGLTGPPWRHGNPEARFTLTLYADLECPFCKAYYPTLMAWIDGHPEANLQWHHLPLVIHEPAAAQLARVAECAGEAGGHAAFFEAVGWLYRHTRGDGQGLAADLRYPGLTPAMQGCLDSERPRAIVRTQADDATHSGITATPTVRLADHRTGKALLLHGPVEGDALLSALDLIASDGAEGAITAEATEMPAAPSGDMPR